MAGTAIARARDVARRMGLGRLRDRSLDRLTAAHGWAAVPPYRLKDLELKSSPDNARVALTFDDGPNPYVTPQLLDLLDSRAAGATFFMCGLAANRHPELVREVHSRGHTIGGHSWDHPHSGVTGLDDAGWLFQIDRTHQLLADLTGEPVEWFRPPRGIIDRKTRERLWREGVTTMMWSVDAWDCSLRDPKTIAAGVIRGLRPGGVVLMHDANATFLYAKEKPAPGEVGDQRSTLEAVRIVLDWTRDSGLDSISLGQVSSHARLRYGMPMWMARSAAAGDPA